MRLLFLFLLSLSLVGCAKEIVYSERIVYVYPSESQLLDNGQVNPMPPEQFNAMDVDSKLEYSSNLTGQYSTLYEMCRADKRAIRTWVTEKKQQHQESSTGRKQ